MPEIVSKERMERDTSRPISAHSTFVNGYPLAGTYRFGDIAPHFVQEVIPDDDITMNSSHQLRTYSMKAPLMQDLRIKKDYFFVPYPAILPLNYEKFITNPNIGDDVNAELVGTTIKYSWLANIISKLYTYADNIFSDITETDENRCKAYFNFVLAVESIFSEGSLLASLGCHLSTTKFSRSFETWFGNMMDALLDENNDVHITITFDGYATHDFNNTEFHTMLDLMRKHPDFIVNTWTSTGGDSNFDDLFNAADPGDFMNDFDPGTLNDQPINLARLYSYQIVCAHFFTNDKIDYVYSAELYRQLIYSLLSEFNALSLGWVDEKFTANSIDYHYDTLSAFQFYRMNQNISSIINNSIAVGYVYDFLRLIFGYNHSLRHVDYFTGSRTRPLAVGNVGVSVNANVVNVVESIQTTWFARFLNQVNRTGRRLSNYIKGMFPGVSISPDWHEPLWLGHTEDKVVGDETSNTGSDQLSKPNSVTQVMLSNAERFGFNFRVNQYYGVVIGVTYFDLERFYTHCIERPVLHTDRFDMFNPFLQFNGDQYVYETELFGRNTSLPLSPFSYNSRYIEYKERVPQSFGGFNVGSLPGYLFLADSPKDSFVFNELNPEYIRSVCSELDQFFVSLTGYSLASYFHFAIINRNHVKSVRPMVANPQLG